MVHIWLGGLPSACDQWGRSGFVQTAAGSVVVAYPLAFTSAVFSVNATAYVGTVSSASVASVVVYNNTQVTLCNGDVDTNYPYIFWVAIGA